ncbi:MAG: DUF5103 domain-containing protein [Prevotellaceae bacterium]|jgi:hypothetical protein|nr:DUF5103 domain-containing protein [Prevotellaceae bacterium]
MISEKTISIIMLILFSVNVSAQNETELNRKFGFRDFCFDKNIRTLLAYKTGNEMSEPYVELNSNENITFAFDDLSEASRDFYYVIKHCNADWEEDNLFVSDYMTGFAENNIFRFNSSINTTVYYKHYVLTIPNEDVRIVTSGNYLLKVYDRYDNKPVFQKGFKIFENKVALSLKYRHIVNYRTDGKQQLEFSVNRGSLRLQNPYSELKLRIEQNSQRVPSQAPPTISFQNNMVIDYSNATKNIFKGENEYRLFDTRSLAYNAEGVNRIINQNGEYHVLLNIDRQTDRETYQYNRDINGKYYIEADRMIKNSTDKNLEADYVNVYFTIEDPNPQSNITIYVYGALSDWGLKPECRMEYNESRQAYETTLLLKQGYYNYKYVAVDNKMNFLSDFFDESFAQTENEYTVNVYYRGMHDRWDRLVAIESINTVK